jgi:putative peptide zinc metalloprotease protein
MLCSVCRRQVLRTDTRCRACGTPLDGERHLDVVLPGGERIALDRRLVIGRSRACELRLQEPSVSRIHAAIEVADGEAQLADLGSSYGTFLDGRRVADRAALAPGMRIDVGDCRLDVAERVDATAAGVTVSVPAGLSLIVPAIAGAARRPPRRSRQPGHAARRPRMHSGWSLKRMDATEGDKRYVLKDHRSGDLLALAEPEAELTRMLDGHHELPELIAEAEARCGPEVLERLARLLAELADHGMLAGIDDPASAADQPRRPGFLERLMTPRRHDYGWIPGAIARIYRDGGFLLFTAPALALLGAVALVGLAAFVALVAGGGGTPLVVARQVGLGAIVFVLGRLVLVICHELAHGLCAESFGRPVTRAGLKVALVFPYAFVDTTDAWFEPRRRRIAISLAGPLSDLTLGGVFAIACRASPTGALHDVLFQLAFGGYVGALFNLNPLLERDGYHVLVDALREPGLRRRAARRVTDAIAGEAPAGHDRLLGYGIASLGWSLVMVAFAVVMSLRYYDRLAGLIPPALVWTVLAAFYLVLALPLTITLLRPLWTRAGQTAGTGSPAGAG